MRIIKIGKAFINLDMAKYVTGLEIKITLKGEDAEEMRRILEALAVEWPPKDEPPKPTDPTE